MKILSSIKAAAFTLAFAALAPSIFAVSETYIPSNAKFALYINANKAVNSASLQTLLYRDGIDLAKSLDDVAMVLGDLTGDVSFFLTEIDPGDFEHSLMDVVLYAPGRVNDIYKRLAAREDIKTEASTIPGARILKIHVVNGKTDSLAFFEFVSDDIMQCRLAINLPDTKPYIWTVNPNTPMMVTSMKAKGALVSAGVDAAYVQGKLKAEEEAHPRTAEEKKTQIKAGDGGGFGLDVVAFREALVDGVDAPGGVEDDVHEGLFEVGGIDLGQEEGDVASEVLQDHRHVVEAV